MLTTTLKEIRENSPCQKGWEKLLKRLGKTDAEAKSCTDELTIMTVLESNGPEFALWVLDNCIGGYICRLLKADYAERVLHIFESKLPDDKRPRKAIEVARDPNATSAERDAAQAAARAAAGAAAWDAERDAAWEAARAAAGAAAGDAAWDAAWEAERKAQESRLRQYLTHGEAAKDMPWD